MEISRIDGNKKVDQKCNRIEIKVGDAVITLTIGIDIGGR